MADEPKSNEKKPEDLSEDTEEQEIEESQTDEIVENREDSEDTSDSEETVTDEPETEDTEEKSEDKIEEKPEEKPVEGEKGKIEKPMDAKKPEEAEVKKEKPKKDRGPDFKYIVRLSDTDVDGEKNVVYGLSSIKGIGIHMATLIADETKIDKNVKMGDLKDDQIEKLQQAIDNVANSAPRWMLNHRKDYETGKDIHLIGPEIDMRLRDEINIMKKIRSYRGIRHERGLPVRGQRTRANNRKGLALGVSKKRVQGGASE